MYEACCISGGSTKLVTLCGLMYEYHERGLLQSIKTWSACSAGAYIAVLYLCGKNPLQALDYYPKIENIEMSMEIFNTFMQKQGLKRIQKYSGKVRRCINNYVFGNPEKDCTLLDFYKKTGVTFYIEAVNVDDAEVVYFNHKDHPNVKLIDCLHATAAIPLIFINVKIDGKKYTDGGIYTSLPLEPLGDLKTIAFGFQTPKRDGVMDQILSLFRLPSTLVKKQDLKRHPNVILVECKSNFDIFDFEKTKEEILEEFAYGRSQFHSLSGIKE